MGRIWAERLVATHGAWLGIPTRAEALSEARLLAPDLRWTSFAFNAGTFAP
jgi:hypothetical protein